MNDVTVSGENTLTGNEGVLVQEAVSIENSLSSSVAEHTAFTRLKEGIAGEESRPVLREMVVDCLVPEFVRRPEHALGLITTLEAPGFHPDELLSGLRALRVVRDPGVLTALAHVGRRWGATNDVF